MNCFMSCHNCDLRLARKENTVTIVSKTHSLMILFQVADSMEVNILGIIGPILKCEWLLHDWQVALYSSVSITTTKI